MNKNIQFVMEASVEMRKKEGTIFLLHKLLHTQYFYFPLLFSWHRGFCAFDDGLEIASWDENLVVLHENLRNKAIVWLRNC